MEAQRKDWHQRIGSSVMEAASLLSGVTDEQLNWRPTPGEWSIGQHVAHLAIVTELVNEKIAAAVGRAPLATLASPWRPRWLERKLLAGVGPQSPGRQVPVPRLFLPGDNPFAVVSLQARFVAVHEAFLEQIVGSEGIDIVGTRAASAALPLLQVSLACWFEAMAIHVAYHLSRAEDVRRDPAFPAS